MANEPKMKLALVGEMPENPVRGTVYMSPDVSGNFIKVGVDSGVRTIFDGSFYLKKVAVDGSVLTPDASGVVNIPSGGGSTDLLVPITYSELKNLRDNGNLVPGMQYRITDYQCTTTQIDTSTADNIFDIIVIADSSSILNENARAIQHAGDTYFSDNNLKAWELKYTIDNDNSVYGWADIDNGKGVIYWMKDEFGNECPYDFKNILMKIYSISERYSISQDKEFLKDKGVYISKRVGSQYSMMNWCNMEFDSTSDTKYVYTFDIEVNNTHYDFSNNVYPAELYPACTITCHNNIIKPFSVSLDYTPKRLYINFITFTIRAYNEIIPDSSSGSDIEGGTFLIYDNFFNSDCHDYRLTSNNNDDYILGIKCYNNKFGINNRESVVIIDYYNNIIGDDSERYIIDENCYNNTFGRHYYRNVFRDNCYNNIVGNNFTQSYFAAYCYDNVFCNDCHHFTFGQYCDCNIFGNTNETITFGNYCENNLFGNDCMQIQLADGCSNNKFGNECVNNTLSGNSSYNTFGNYCTVNNFGYNCRYNTLNNYCSRIKLGTCCEFNTFGDFCDRINFGDASTAQSYFRYNIIENGNRLINFKTDKTTSGSNCIQNVKIVQGVNNNSSTYKTITHTTVNDTHQTIYQPVNSSIITV